MPSFSYLSVGQLQFELYTLCSRSKCEYDTLPTLTAHTVWKKTERSGLLSPHTQAEGYRGRWWAWLGQVNLEAPADMSALKLGCEGLGPAKTSGVVYPWLSQSTVYPNPDPRRGPGDTLQVWVPSPLRSVPSGFLCDCLISPEPNTGSARSRCRYTTWT